MKKKKIIRAVTADCSLCFVEPSIPLLKEKYEVQLLSSPGSRLDNTSREFGIKAHGVDMFRRISPLKDIRALFRILRIFLKEKPYIVHSMTPKAGLLCMMAARIARVPVRIHTFTGLVWPTSSGLLRRVLMFTDRLTCMCATHIIPEGQGVLDDLRAHITRKDMKVLGYGNVKGVDMEIYSRRPEVMALAGKIRENRLFTFIFVGRIVGDKGINELVRAFCRLSLSHPDIRLLLVGGREDGLDPLQPDVEREMESNPRIILAGERHGDEVLARYAASDCLVFPSYREGFPNVVLEAGAMGLPSIVTDINGSREIITDGVNGLIVPPHDTEALSAAMERLMMDRNLASRMAAAARPMIGSRFEQTYVSECLDAFYDEVAGTPRSASLSKEHTTTGGRGQGIAVTTDVEPL